MNQKPELLSYETCTLCPRLCGVNRNYTTGAAAAAQL